MPAAGGSAGLIVALAGANALHRPRRTALLLLLWNSSVALALQLHGTMFFWLLLAVVNLAFLLVSEPQVVLNVPEKRPGNIVDETVAVSHFLAFGQEPGCVEDGDAAKVLVRGPHFATKREKEPSQEAFYELVRVQVQAPPANGGKHCHLCATSTVLEEELRDVSGPLPQFFVLNVQLPEKGKPGQPSTSVAIYFRVRPDTQAAAADLDAGTPALRLLLDYCSNAPSRRSLQEKLKIICTIENPAECGLPDRVLKYFSKEQPKPALITNCGTLYTGPGYVEMDVDVSGANYMLRSGMHQMQSAIGAMDLRVAVVIQGDGIDQLPERVLGSAMLHRVSLDAQVFATRAAFDQHSGSTGSLCHVAPLSAAHQRCKRVTPTPMD